MNDVQIFTDIVEAIEASAYQNYVVDHMLGLITVSYDEVKSLYVIEATHHMNSNGMGMNNTEYGHPRVVWKSK